MHLDYKVKEYANLESLKEEHVKLANSLLRVYAVGEWTKDYILVFPTVADMAKFDMVEGSLIHTTENYINDLKSHSSLNPLEYVNYTKLGEEMLRLDKGNYLYKTPSGKVIMSCVGFLN